MIRPKRGEIYLVKFDPTSGSEIRKTRPALVLQNDCQPAQPHHDRGSNHFAVDAALYPTEVLIKPPEGGLTKDAVVLLNQVRSIDKGRLIKRLGVLKPATMQNVDRAQEISLGLGKL